MQMIPFLLLLLHHHHLYYAAPLVELEPAREWRIMKRCIAFDKLKKKIIFLKKDKSAHDFSTSLEI